MIGETDNDIGGVSDPRVDRERRKTRQGVKIDSAMAFSFLAGPISRLAPVVYSSDPRKETHEQESKRGAVVAESDSVELSPDAQRAAVDQLQHLDEAEQKLVQELKARDREVRSHEAAHAAAAGPYGSGGPSFTFQKGPDGRRYAIGGEVQIDASPVKNDPEATIRKMQIIRAAALAPADPSGQDRAVAAAASRMAAEAAAELARQQLSPSDSEEERDDPNESAALGQTFDVVA